ncbi:MAG: Tol-Pal system protein TolB [Holosporales bacterium]
MLKLFVSFFIFAYASAVPVIEITQGQIRPEPISLSPSTGDLSDEFDAVIANDLDSSGAFIIMDKAGFIQSSDSIQKEGARYEDWRITKTRFLFVANIKQEGSSVTVSFQLHDVIRGKKMVTLTLSGERKKWRRIAHMVADVVYHHVTGEDGFFNTQLAFVQPTNAKGRNQNTCLKLMDADGYADSIVQLTDGKRLVLTPRYAPDGKTLAYLVLDKDKGEVYILDLQTKVSRLMGKYKGLSFAPRYSPDGRKIVFSIAKNGTTAIYQQDLYSQELKQLTPHSNIDVSPGFSPDGRKIVFVSNRAGTGGLYTMNADGSDQTRISFGKGLYTQPCWSPRGDLIAFTLQKGGKFYIGVVRPDGTDERLVASGYLVEDPIWTSNGRFLIFTVQDHVGGKQRIVRMDLTGHHQYAYKTPGEAFGPSLSPLLGSAIQK